MNFNIQQILKLKNLSFLCALFFYAITAFNSHGYFHGDEHFQIIEFAYNRLADLPRDWLAWEHKDAIRPAIQVNIAYLLLGLMRFLGFENPINQMIVIRLITAIACVFSIRYFVNSTKKHFKNRHHLAYEAISYLLWFIPVLAARFSSETTSAIFFLCAIAFYFKNKNHLNWFKLAILMGFSFLFRFQIAFAFLGFIIWLFQVKKETIKSLSILSLGVLVVLLFGIINDRFFYGQFEFTPFNYFKSALIDGVEFDFGSEPWHFFISCTYTYLTEPLAIISCMALLFLLYKKPKSWILFVILPFLFLHSYFDHKEIRFIFPIAFLLPYLIFAAIERLPKWVYIKSRQIYFGVLVLFLGLNAIGIFINTQKSAGNAQVEMIRYLDNNYREKEVVIHYVSFANPFDPWQGLHAHFYKPVQYKFKRIKNSCELTQQQFNLEKTNLFLIRQFDLERDPCLEELNTLGFKFQKQSMSEFIKKVAKHYDGLNGDANLVLYSLDAN